MSAIVADTNAVIWHLFDPGRLSPAGSVAISTAIRTGYPIYVSTISVVEIAYLVEKGKFLQNVFEQVLNALIDPAIALTPVELDLNIAQVLKEIPRDVVPDMPDRMITATALHLNLPLVTSDAKIRATHKIQTIW